MAALKLWSDYGKENDEQFCNARYLVWVCQHVLFASHNDGASSLDELQSWQRAMEELVNNNNGGGGEEESDEMGGVMWEMLLRSLALTPDQLQSAYRKALEYNPHIRNIDDISYCFVWPSFFKGVVDEASDNNRQGGGKSKRRKGNHGNKLAMQQSNLTNTAWWPLLGYTITHAVLSASSSKNNTLQQKIHQLQSSIMDSLPSLMGIPCFDYVKRHALLSGVVACILDVVGGGLVFGSLSLDHEGSGGGIRQGGGGIQHDILGVGVDQIVDLLLNQQGWVVIICLHIIVVGLLRSILLLTHDIITRSFSITCFHPHSLLSPRHQSLFIVGQEGEYTNCQSR